ncbi:hypothetical protein GQ55_7G275700 [Panicum hallii var. hallii]|uniref:Uncharacterized protein n=2 Tax=Panicum hallii TaxID=206008 RepID=A0A2T7CZN9_9POAL|nr:hypothetical protein GQ55_7G275700 [Panicum hallii var. hallii]PVH35809.1 hypothetical protein PAHAL_7G284000 [Panicum hallii]
MKQCSKGHAQRAESVMQPRMTCRHLIMKRKYRHHQLPGKLAIIHACKQRITLNTNII